MRSRLRGAAPEQLSVHLDHRDPKLIQTIRTIAGGREQRLEFVFTTDGRESINMIGGAAGVTHANWRGAELVIESSIALAGRDLHFCDYWSLSPDGQILTMEHRDDDLAGQITVLRRAPLLQR